MNEELIESLARLCRIQDQQRFTALIAEECAILCDQEVQRLTAIKEHRPALIAGICAAAIRAKFPKP